MSIAPDPNPPTQRPGERYGDYLERLSDWHRERRQAAGKVTSEAMEAQRRTGGKDADESARRVARLKQRIEDGKIKVVTIPRLRCPYCNAAKGFTPTRTLRDGGTTYRPTKCGVCGQEFAVEEEDRRS